MNKIMIAAIALLSSACVVHAHPPPAPKPAPAPVVHPHGHAHTPAPNAHNVNVRAWVWVSGHRTRHGGWVQGFAHSAPAYARTSAAHSCTLCKRPRQTASSRTQISLKTA